MYNGLVARGERVVASARTEQAKSQLSTAKAEIKDAEKVENKVAAEHMIEKHAADQQAPNAVRAGEDLGPAYPSDAK